MVVVAGDAFVRRRPGRVLLGENRSGQLGLGVGAPVAAPTSSNVAAGAVLAAGGDPHCALDSSGQVSCWGDNEFGQIGDGTVGRSLVAVEVTFPP